MIKFKISINGTDFTSNVTYPVNYSDLLDESLDQAFIQMRTTEKEFNILSDVHIVIIDGTGEQLTKDYIISRDKAIEIPIGSGIYKHEIELIERTKLLEGFIVDSISFNNVLAKNISPSNVTPIEQLKEETPLGFEIDEVDTYTSPKEYLTSFTIKSQYEMLSTYYMTQFGGNPTSEQILRPAYYDNKTFALEIYVNNKLFKTISNIYEGYTFNSLPYGNITIFYGFSFTNGGLYNIIYSYTFRVVNTSNIPNWTIASVIDRVLDLAEPLRYNKTTGIKDTPRYKLNEAQHEEFDLIESPEFAFTSDTLREILNKIGEKLHAMPRLIGNEIYYDKYGGTEYATVASGALLKDCNQCVYKESEYSLDDYATGLDSTVDNLVNKLSHSTLIEPYANGYKTVRSETGYIRVTDENMIIETEYPIYDVSKLEVGFMYAGQAFTVKTDITSYVYEYAQYENLSSVYNGKSYALYFTQGENNIKGLNFKDPNTIDDSLNNYSIINIILEAAQGISGFDRKNIEYPGISFRISYTPIYTARIQQNKTYYIENSKPFRKVYNQGSNLIETRYYGENLKGTIARIGNKQRKLTYVFKNIKSIPKAGQLFDDDLYISSVNVSINPEHISVTIDLSENWNMLSQYIGIDSKKRYYEVSEKQAVTRISNYTDYILISNEPKPFGASFFNEQDFYAYILGTLTKDYIDYRKSKISFVKAYGQRVDGTNLPTIILPVIASAFGNAMVFTFKYADSYSAGNTVSEIHMFDINGYYQNGCEYCDAYGRMEYLNFDFYDNGINPQTYGASKVIGMNLPLTSSMLEINDGNITDPTENIKGAITTGNMPIVYRKNSTEIPNINYQIEFVTDDRNIIIGSAFAKNCQLVSGYLGHTIKFYILPNKINKFIEKIDLKGAKEVVIDPNYNETDVYIGLGFITGDIAERSNELTITNNLTGQAWAVVDTTTNELLFGSNKTLNIGDVISPYISFVGKIYN